MVEDGELHPYFKNVINIFVCIKLNFFLTIFLLYLIHSLSGHRNKTHPRRHEYNLKKVGAIPMELTL